MKSLKTERCLTLPVVASLEKIRNFRIRIQVDHSIGEIRESLLTISFPFTTEISFAKPITEKSMDTNVSFSL